MLKVIESINLTLSSKVTNLRGYSCFLYLLMCFTVISFFYFTPQWNTVTICFAVCAAAVMPLIYMVPYFIGCGVTLAITHFIRQVTLQKVVARSIIVGSGFLVSLALAADWGIYRGFGFHFNPLIWNLLSTPGGFASMGLRGQTILTVVGGTAFLVLLHAAAFYTTCHFNWPQWWFSRRKLFFGITFLALPIMFCLFSYSYENFRYRPQLIEAAHTLPGFPNISMRKFFLALGMRQPARVESNFAAVKDSAQLNYPLTTIIRRQHSPKYNVIWLTVESWRGDMVTPEIMPNLTDFSRQTINFKNHYSGGNGTRAAMFAMFYGLYPTYWKSMIKNNQGPLFINWLKEDGYDFQCLTSALFTYPEFDRTIFLNVPGEALKSDSDGATYERDQRNTKRFIDYLKQRNSDKPFFAFMFFESPHAPYEFPADAIIRPDFMEELNYATLTAKDAQKIKNRYLNSCHHLDQRLGEIIAVVKEKKLLDNTIIVIAGDHGEEFFEKGYLGHNSSFVEEQIRPPLLLYIPGVPPSEYTAMSSHLDIIPTLAPFFGVENPAEDFSLGINLLADQPQRSYTIAGNWEKLAFISSEYKTILPQNSFDFTTQKLTDGKDQPRNDLKEFYRKNDLLLFQIKRNSVKFIR